MPHPLIAGRNSANFSKRASSTMTCEVCVNITIRKAGPATILDLSGPLKLGGAEDLFRKRIRELLNAGATHLAVNLSGVTNIDSSGIGALVHAYTSIKRSGGKCTFFSPCKLVLTLLKMVRLDNVLDLAEDEATALARI